MGFLEAGIPIPWEDAVEKGVNVYVREHGVIQFLNLFNHVKGRSNDILLWGDEIEYMVLERDDSEKIVRLSLRADDILNEAYAIEKSEGDACQVSWKVEWGNFMLESKPSCLPALFCPHSHHF